MAVIIQQVYPGRGYERLLAEFSGSHADYCTAHGIEYQALVRQIRYPIEEGGWDKIILIQNSPHELAIWLDADTFIYDLSADLNKVPNPPDTIGVIHFPTPSPHWNVGVLYVRKGPRVEAFLSEWLSMHPNYLTRHWRDQMAFQDLAKKQPEVVFTLPAEWNCSVRHNWNGKPIVAAVHGEGIPDNRLRLMRLIRDDPEFVASPRI